MALIPRRFFVRLERTTEAFVGDMMNEIDPILALSPQNPTGLVQVAVDGGGAGFEIDFNSEDEAHLFEKAFG
jgi:hypothetical protein